MTIPATREAYQPPPMVYEFGRVTEGNPPVYRFVRLRPFVPPPPINGVLSSWFAGSVDDAGSPQMLGEHTAVGTPELRVEDTDAKSQTEQLRVVIGAGAPPDGSDHDGEEEEVEKALDMNGVVHEEPEVEANENESSVNDCGSGCGNGGGPGAPSLVMVGVGESSMIC